MKTFSGGHLRHDLQVLSEDECFELLTCDTFGRVVYTWQAMPAIVPVNYVMDGCDILLRTDPNSQLGRAIDGSVVAFEIDSIDRSAYTGWSVVVIGKARAVRDADGQSQTTKVQPDPWASGTRALLVRITPGEVSGRRLGPLVDSR